MPRDPKNNMKAAEDFMLSVLYAHVVSAANAIQSYMSYSTIGELANAIVANYVLLPEHNYKVAHDDKVHLYACETLTLGLLWLGFYDSIKEGDGDRMLRCWRFLLIVFKSTNHPNYAKEAVNLLMQYSYFFSDRQKAQLLWSRCVNTKGVKGCNITCDLHMEHLVRQVKTMKRYMGGNISPQAIVKAGKSITVSKQVCSTFEERTMWKKAALDSHSNPSLQKDIMKMVEVLDEERVFTPVKRREHSSFSNMKCGLMHKNSRSDLAKKVQNTIDKISSV